MSYKNKISFLALSLCFALAGVQAQKPLSDESVDIVKDFDARLLESNKLTVSPSLPPLDTTTKKQDYLVPARPLNVGYDAPKLRPVGMKTTGKEKFYNGFLKAGAGIPSSLYGEAGYGLSKEKFNGKLWLRHHSANFKSLENQKFFNNDALLNGTIYLENKMAVEGKVGYSYDRVHYYGYDHDSLEFDAEGVRQDFKILDAGVRLFNSERNDLDLNYFIAPNFYLLNDYYGNRETGFNLNLGATKWFAEKHPLTVVIRTDFTNFKDSVTQKLNNIYLQPSFTFHADFLKIKLGGNFASNRDVFNVIPDIELTLKVWGDGIQLFGGLGGDLRKNTYRTISEYNPFIEIRGSEIRNTVYRNYYGGLKGNLGWLEYNGQISYGTADDLALYQTRFEPNGVTRFTVLYDSAQIYNLQGTIKLSPIKDLVLRANLSQNVFTFQDSTQKAWGLPGLEGKFSAVYTTLGGKASLRGEVYLADRIKRLDREGISGKDGALLDVSLGASYYFTDNIGVFLDINNLLNNKRERWHNYPMYGLNILGGVTARF